jgi:hypothetical protein
MSLRSLHDRPGRRAPGRRGRPKRAAVGAKSVRSPRRGGLFVRAEMDNHLWSETLRCGGLATGRTEVAAEVMKNGSRCLQLGRRLRLVNGPLAGCLGLVVGTSVHIVRHLPAWEEAEYVEPVH